MIPASDDDVERREVGQRAPQQSDAQDSVPAEVPEVIPGFRPAPMWIDDTTSRMALVANEAIDWVEVNPATETTEAWAEPEPVTELWGIELLMPMSRERLAAIGTAVVAALIALVVAPQRPMIPLTVCAAILGFLGARAAADWLAHRRTVERQKRWAEYHQRLSAHRALVIDPVADPNTMRVAHQAAMLVVRAEAAEAQLAGMGFTGTQAVLVPAMARDVLKSFITFRDLADRAAEGGHLPAGRDPSADPMLDEDLETIEIALVNEATHVRHRAAAAAMAKYRHAAQECTELVDELERAANLAHDQLLTDDYLAVHSEDEATRVLSLPTAREHLGLDTESA